MNFLFCCVGRRAELLRDFKASLSKNDMIIATDSKKLAPALQFADKRYIVPPITDPKYIEIILSICEKEQIDVITTLIDPEIELLAKNKHRFQEKGILVLAPDAGTAGLCFDKFKMYRHLTECRIPTPFTLDNIGDFEESLRGGKIDFPVFVKPRYGSGSVGARKITEIETLREAFSDDPGLIVQEFMDCLDIDVDIYIDTITKKAARVFAKRKMETRIGGANITISFLDSKLDEFVSNAVEQFSFSGPIDMDLFYKNGQYYLSEVNPRFGGAYLHAYGAGVDFTELIIKNKKGIINEPKFGGYKENFVMMMFDSVVFGDADRLVDYVTE